MFIIIILVLKKSFFKYCKNKTKDIWVNVWVAKSKGRGCLFLFPDGEKEKLASIFNSTIKFWCKYVDYKLINTNK